jgi:OOP family OmpA-OmpF porin
MLALAGLSLTAAAQEETPTLQYSVATNRFACNWFLQAGADWGAWYSGQEHGLGLPHSPLKSFRGGPSASLAVGKWFTPGIGLRTRLQGIWGKTVDDGTKAGNLNRCWLLNEQVLLNMSNLLCGYNPQRVWSFIPFVGGGIGHSMTADTYSTVLSAGILNEFRVSRRVSVNVEAGWNYSESDLDGNGNLNGHRGWESHDNNLYAEVGLTFNLGRTAWDRTPDVDAVRALSQSQVDALNAQLADANTENARLKDMLARQAEVKAVPETVKELVTTPVSVFFNIGRSDIASQKDLVNVRALARYAKENNARLRVTGFADSATGTAAFNKSLSERRAVQVADELVRMGIARDNIATAAGGGVNDLSPVPFNRRATVQVAE